MQESERLGLQASELYLDLNKLVRAAKELTPIGREVEVWNRRIKLDPSGRVQEQIHAR